MTRKQLLEAYTVNVASRIELAKGHIELCQRKANRLLDPAAMPGDLLQSLVNRRVEVLLPALPTHPGWHVIHIDRAAFEMKSGADNALFNFPLAEFAGIIGCHL